MELLQLKYFKIVAENPNLTTCAKQLYISPSSLSATISRLERELGTQLFDRCGKKLYLNAKGQLYLEYVNQVLSLLDNAATEIRSMDQDQDNILSIATTSPNVWVELFSSFKIKYPEVKTSQVTIKLDALNAPNCLNVYDFVIASPEDVPANWSCKEILYDDDWPVLLVHPDHPLSKRKSINLLEVKESPFIALSSGFSSRKYFDTLCQMAGFEPSVAIECEYMMRSYMVMQKIGIAVATGYTNYARLHDGTCCIDIDYPVFPRIQALYYNPQKHRNSAADKFLKFASDFYPGKSCKQQRYFI